MIASMRSTTLCYLTASRIPPGLLIGLRVVSVVLVLSCLVFFFVLSYLVVACLVLSCLCFVASCFLLCWEPLGDHFAAQKWCCWTSWGASGLSWSVLGRPVGPNGAQEAPRSAPDQSVQRFKRGKRSLPGTILVPFWGPKADFEKRGELPRRQPKCCSEQGKSCFPDFPGF